MNADDVKQFSRKLNIDLYFGEKMIRYGVDGY